MLTAKQISHLRHFLAFMFVVLFSTSIISQNGWAQDRGQKTETVLLDSTSKLKQVVRQAFISSHNGYSSDEVVLNNELNSAFIEACKKQLPAVSSSELNWTLLNLRKAGYLNGIKTTRRGQSSTQSVQHIAEIAARQMQDIHEITTDRIMANPELREQFNEIAKKLSPEVDLYLARKAAFQLRKTRKLKPELITRIADWNRVISEFSAAQIKSDFSLVPEHPGIYIFRDKTGYLYIGQSEDLRSRLQSHLDQSSSVGLANYLARQGAKNISIELHSFPPDSRAKETRVRRAYESELIRNRKPRFNIQP